ncbi:MULTISPECIES: S1 RNA-binding domain-containing protein [Bacteroides]|uniref:S1 RNA-binding domain-containing protein n=1 Tax=Bacteroides TaxID=816 RepID=UPI00331340E9
MDQKYDGKIISIKPHGAIVEFKSGFVGYLNKHHLNWERTKILTKTNLQVGDKIKVKIIKFKPIAIKYILSHRILLPKPISKKKNRKLSKR